MNSKKMKPISQMKNNCHTIIESIFSYFEKIEMEKIQLTDIVTWLHQTILIVLLVRKKKIYSKKK